MSLKQEIQTRLKSLGAEPKRALGQNFLIDQNVVDMILARVNRFKPVALLEVGPGLGALTSSLIKLEAPLSLIELDSQFSQLWKDKGLPVVEADALKLDWQGLGLAQGTVLVSNLPYQISSSLVIERSLGPECITGMVLMFQKEVAQRIVASPRSKDYGLLSVIAQLYWQIHKVCEAGPRCFWPAPKVASRVLGFERREHGPGVPNKELLRFVKAAFSHRRKVLWKNLAGECGHFGVDKDLALQAGQDLNLGGQVRAEELAPEQFVQLYEALHRLSKTRNKQ